MRYIDKYPHCTGCPVTKYCGTMVSSIRLCNSYQEPEESKKTAHILTLSKAASNEDMAAEEKLGMWDCITD